MAHDNPVTFLLDGQTVRLDNVDPTATVLEYLRYTLRRTGTKEGCAEGDCGACTVLVGELGEDGQGVHWRSVNSCILFLPMLHGKALMTVESLSKPSGALNPLQCAMAANGSSQCGFCTPGFVMALQGRAMGALGHDLPVEDGLAGNLCRCTGYGPILDAGRDVTSVPQDDAALATQLRALGPAGAGGTFGKRRWFAPRSRDELATILAQHPDARMVAGATDVGLWVTKGLRELETVVFIGDVADLRTIEETSQGVRLGAGVRYAEAHGALARLHGDLGELVRRFAGLQVRSAGTIGGNIANGSPIGDGPPALIALGATLTLGHVQGSRTVALEDFFLDYGKQDLRPGEFVESVFVPRPQPEQVIHIAKLSRRFDSDISAVCGAVMLTIRHGMITAARVAFGGMAATPRRARACEAALIDAPFEHDTMVRAAAALHDDFTPLSDVRGSREYRLTVAGNLLHRLHAREQGEAISVLDLVEAAHG